MSEYSDKLRDPRWQRKRLEIFERDGWKCQFCGDEKSTLVVHHKLYIPGREPWDYPNNHLVTLCENCHEAEYSSRSEMEYRLITALKLVAHWTDIEELALSFGGISPEQFQKLMSMITDEALGGTSAE